MRTSELDRLNFLINKKETGEQLSEKEYTRLASLLEKQQKEGVINGQRRTENTGDATGNRGDNAGGDNNPNGGEKPRESKSAQYGDGNKTNRNNGGVNKLVQNVDNGNNGANDGSIRPIGDIGGSNRAKSRKPPRQSGGNDRDDRRTETGRIDGSAEHSSGESDENEKINISGVTNVKPKDIKPKRKKAPSKKTNELDADVLSALIQSGFSLIAGISSRKHWEVSEEEANTIADPLEKILDNMTAKQKKAIEKYSAPIMLAGAVAGIVVPRVMVDIYLIKNKKGVVPNVRSEKTIESDIARDVTTNIKIGDTNRPGENSANVSGDSPVNDSVITGLFRASDK